MAPESYLSSDGPMFLPLPSDIAQPYGSVCDAERLEPQLIPIPNWTEREEANQLVDISNMPKLIQLDPSLCNQGSPIQGKKDSGPKTSMKELGQQVAELVLKRPGKENRWWTRCKVPLTCPLTGFPIALLPYPPFKLRMQADEPNPHALVDGKYLALQLISTGSFDVCHRTLQASDITVLDQYIHKCKLSQGTFRPAHALALSADAVSLALSLEERNQAQEELTNLRGAAKVELGKLRRIQEQRLLAVHKQLTKNMIGLGDGTLPDKQLNMTQTPSVASTCSGGSSESDSNFEFDFSCDFALMSEVELALGWALMSECF